MVGIWPSVGARNVEFLAAEVPDMTMREEILDRMLRANEKSKEHALVEVIAISCEALERVWTSVQGIQVGAPIGPIERGLSEILSMSHILVGRRWLRLDGNGRRRSRCPQG